MLRALEVLDLMSFTGISFMQNNIFLFSGLEIYVRFLHEILESKFDFGRFEN